MVKTGTARGADAGIHFMKATVWKRIAGQGALCSAISWAVKSQDRMVSRRCAKKCISNNRIRTWRALVPFSERKNRCDGRKRTNRHGCSR